MADPIAIPGPPGLPLIGNITDVDPANSVASLSRIAETYGVCSISPLWQETIARFVLDG